MKSSEPRAIALVLATYNRSGPLERLLVALERQTLPRDQWEAVVVVDGSTDDTEQVLDRWMRRGTLPLQFLCQSNAGQAVARHAGILRASAESIVIVDDDMEVCPEFLAEHLAVLNTAPGKAIAIGKVVPERGFMKKPLYTAVQEHYMYLLHLRLERGELATATAFVTQNVSFPRRMYLEVGGFDPLLRLDEDRELGVRLERAGAVFLFAPKAWAIHHSDVGSYGKWFQRHYDYGRYAVQIWEKHGHSAHLHPLRNFVDGSRINRALVTLTCGDDTRSRLAASGLRRLGNLLQRLDLLQPAIYTHKAIQAVRYHLGVRDTLGSWDALREMEKAYVAHPDRPREPTGRGITYERAANRAERLAPLHEAGRDRTGA